MTQEEYDKLPFDDQQRYMFGQFFAKFGQWDYTKYMYGKYDDGETGYYRWQCYHDGAWLEGYRLEPVIYWGA